jgi:hypothetical protein
MGHLGNRSHNHEIVKELKPRGVPFFALLRRPQTGPDKEGRAEFGKEFRRLHHINKKKQLAANYAHERMGQGTDGTACQSQKAHKLQRKTMK